MVFNSLIYLLFLFIVVFLFYLLPARLKWVWLLLASIAFYLSYIPVFIILLVFIVLANYFLAKWLAKVPENLSSLIFFLIIAINLIILAFFKYFNNLFPDNQIHLYNVDLFYRVSPINKMILPLGLSYLIFTILSYHIEIKRKNIQPENHLGYFSLYLLFFPKITQGPIERPQHLIAQIREDHPFSSSSIIEGIKLMIWGYFKK